MLAQITVEEAVTVNPVITLSADRARRVHQELTQRHLIPATALSAHGYGEMYPSFPEGTEPQMTIDRRVLVVRKM